MLLPPRLDLTVFHDAILFNEEVRLVARNIGSQNILSSLFKIINDVTRS